VLVRELALQTSQDNAAFGANRKICVVVIDNASEALGADDDIYVARRITDGHCRAAAPGNHCCFVFGAKAQCYTKLRLVCRPANQIRQLAVNFARIELR
jgi:hypothetical protein